MKRIYILLFLHLFLIVYAQAQKRKNKPVRVSAKIAVLMEGNYSKTEIKNKAVQAAKIKAMGDEFGYAIIQGINTQTSSTSGDAVMTSTNISEVSNTMVKGEWVADDAGYPKTRFSIRDKGDDQEIWLECEVKGVARELQEARVDFQAFTYNCREPEKCGTQAFRENDSMFLYFRTPASGYLSVFMWEKGLVYRLLPYAQMKDTYESVVPVEADKEYLLFSPEHRDYFEEFHLVDEYGLTLPEDGEPLSNVVYVIFSPAPFHKPVLEEEDGIKYLELLTFQNWINKNKGLNKNFQVSKFNIVVNK